MPLLREMTASPAGALGAVAVLASLCGFVQALRRRPGRDAPRAGLGAWAVWWLLLPVAVLLSQAIAGAPRPAGGARTAVGRAAVAGVREAQRRVPVRRPAALAVTTRQSRTIRWRR